MKKKTNNKIESRQVIQYMINKCKESSDTLNFSKRVKMLRDFICLEIPELKSTILEKEKQLKLEVKSKVKELFEENPDEYHHPVKRMIHNIDIDKDTHEDLDTFLNDIINKHD